MLGWWGGGGGKGCVGGVGGGGVGGGGLCGPVAPAATPGGHSASEGQRGGRRAPAAWHCLSRLAQGQYSTNCMHFYSPSSSVPPTRNEAAGGPRRRAVAAAGGEVFATAPSWRLRVRLARRGCRGSSSRSRGCRKIPLFPQQQCVSSLSRGSLERRKPAFSPRGQMTGGGRGPDGEGTGSTDPSVPKEGITPPSAAGRGAQKRTLWALAQLQ